MTTSTRTNGAAPHAVRVSPEADRVVDAHAGLDHLALIERSSGVLNGDFDRHTDLLEVAREQGDFGAARAQLELLQANLDLTEVARDLARHAQSAVMSVTKPAVDLSLHVGTLSLSDWYRTLLPPEKLIAISGVESAPGVCTLDYAIPLTGEASGVTFKPDPESTYQVLSRLSASGHRLRAYAHSQPGNGAAATKPSARDRETQRALEAHYRVVGLIFSEDGYLRAYSERLTFDLTISGTNVEVIDRVAHVYRLHPS